MYAIKRQTTIAAALGGTPVAIDNDFWLLLVNLSARLQEQGGTEESRREQLLASLRGMSAPTQSILLNKLRTLAAELTALQAMADEGP